MKIPGGKNTWSINLWQKYTWGKAVFSINGAEKPRQIDNETGLLFNTVQEK